MPDTPSADLHLVQQGRLVVSPLPPPDIARAYDELVPGAAARFLAMMEAEAEHRRAAETEAARQAAAAERRGQRLAFLAGVALAAAAVACAILHASAVGVALAGATILGVVSSFVGRRR